MPARKCQNATPTYETERFELITLLATWVRKSIALVVLRLDMLYLNFVVPDNGAISKLLKTSLCLNCTVAIPRYCLLTSIIP